MDFTSKVFAFVTLQSRQKNSEEWSFDSELGDSDSDSDVEYLMEKRIKVPRSSFGLYFEEILVAYSKRKFIRHFHIAEKRSESSREDTKIMNYIIQ